MISGHGGNKKELAEKLGCPVGEIIDMSSNLNPLGPPEIIEKIICENLQTIRCLPEADAKSMRQGFAGFHGIRWENVIAGNGTTWFIHTIPRALGSKKVLITGPTYSDYKDACVMHNIGYAHLIAKDDDRFHLNMDRLSRACQSADTVFICNPNNPTGILLEKERLEYLIQKHTDTVFIIDESYLPFVDPVKEISLVVNPGYRNIMVLSSMSKIFRVPGLRTGFLSAEENMVQKIMVFYQPWSVNALAQKVIEHIFDHPAMIEPFFRKTRAFIKKEKQKFLARMETVKELTLFDTCTCFILARLNNGMTAKTFCKKIGAHKLLIRDCSNFFGLSKAYVRFSLRGGKTNEHLVKAIKKVLHHA